MDVSQSPESEKINKLKHERISAQQKTFTKWANLHLEKKNLVIDNIFTDFSDGKLLSELLECICGEEIGIVHHDGHQRIHKIENVSRILDFLKKSVKLEGIGAEDIVDGKEQLILGLLWTIILRFGISNIKDEFQNAKSVKEALLLWCKKKTEGYANVEIKNFSSSWRNGLAFNALLHHHMPNLFDYHELRPKNRRKNLKHAFDVAKDELGIGKFLDAEDVDMKQPDEKSIMTYVAAIYQYFAKMKNEEAVSRKLDKCLMNMIDIDKLKNKYNKMAADFLAWTKEAIAMLQLPIATECENVENEIHQLKIFRSTKSRKSSELVRIELLHFDILSKLSSQNFKRIVSPDSLALNKLKEAWKEVEEVESDKECKLKECLCGKEKLTSLEMLDRKMKSFETWLNNMNTMLEKECVEDIKEEDIDAKSKRLDLVESDVKSREVRFEAIENLLQDLQDGNHPSVKQIKERQHNLVGFWEKFLCKIKSEKEKLFGLKCFYICIKHLETVESELNKLKVSPKDVADLNEEHTSSLPVFEINQCLLDEVREKCKENKELIHADQQKQLQEKISNVSLLLQDLTMEGNLLIESTRVNDFVQAVSEVYCILESKLIEIVFNQEYFNQEYFQEDFNSCGMLDKRHQNLETEMEVCQKQCLHLLEESQLLLSCSKASNDNKDRTQVASNKLNGCQKLLREIVNFSSQRSEEAMMIYQYYLNADENESWVSEKLQLISDMDDRKDKHVYTVLLKKIAQIEGKIKVKQSNCNALFEKVSSIQQNENMFDRLNSVVAIFRTSKTCSADEIKSQKLDSNNSAKISDLIVAKQKCYEKKISTTKLDVETREESIIKSFNRIIDECNDKKASLHNLINYSTFKELNDELVKSMDSSIAYISKTDFDKEEEEHILLKWLKKFEDDKITFQELLDKIKECHQVCEGGSFSDNLCIEEIMACTVQLFNNLCVTWKNLDVKISSKHFVQKIFAIGNELIEDFDDQLKEMQHCFDLHNKGYYSEACSKQSMVEELTKLSHQKSAEFSEKINGLSTNDVSLSSIAKLKDEIELKENNVKARSLDLEDRLKKVNGIDAIVKHAEKMLCEATEVEVNLSVPAPDMVNKDSDDEESKERTVLTELSILNKHYQRRKESQPDLKKLSVFDQLEEKQMHIETLISLRKGKASRKSSKAISSNISYIKKNVIEYCKMIEGLHIQRNSNCCATNILSQVEEVHLKLENTMKRIENLTAADARYVSKRNVDITELLDLLNESVQQLVLFKGELVHDKHRQEVIEKMDTFLLWIEEKKCLAQQQLIIDSSTGKTYIRRHKYLKYEIEKSECVMRILMDGGSAMSKRDHLFHENMIQKLTELSTKWKELEEVRKENEVTNDNTLVLDGKEKDLTNIEQWVDCMMVSLNTCKTINCLSESKSILNEYGKLKIKVEKCLDHVNCLNEYFNSVYDMASGTSKLNADIPLYSSLITASKATAITTKVENLELFLAKKCFDAENDGSYQNFLLLCSVETEWIISHNDTAESCIVASTNINSIEYQKSLLRSLNLVCNEINKHECRYKEMVCFGKKCLNNDSVNAENISKLLETLQSSWEELSQLMLGRKNTIKSDIARQDVKNESNTVLSRIDEKLDFISTIPIPNDLVSCEVLLRQNKQLLQEIDFIKNNVKDLFCNSDSSPFKQPSIRDKIKTISVNFPKLETASRTHSKQLRELHMLFSLYFEAECFKTFMVDLSKKLSSDDYGQNYEEVMRLIQRLEIDSFGLDIGNDTLRSMNSFASVILEKEYPHKAAVLIVQQKITTMWERLESKVRQRRKKLDRARQFHKFNLSISNFMSMLNFYNQHIVEFDQFLSAVHNSIELQSKHDNLISFIDKYSPVEREILELETKIQTLTSRYPGKASQKLMSHASTLKNVHNDNATKATNVRNNYKSKINSLDLTDQMKSDEKVWIDNMFCKLAKVKEMADDFSSAEKCMRILSSLGTQFTVKWKKIELVGNGEKWRDDFEDVKILKANMKGLHLTLEEISCTVLIKYNYFKFKKDVNRLEQSLEVFKNDMHKLPVDENTRLPSQREKLFTNRLSQMTENFKILRKSAVRIISSGNSVNTIVNMISKLQDEMEIVQSLYNAKKASMDTSDSLRELLQRLSKLMMWLNDTINILNGYTSHTENTTSLKNFLTRLDADIISKQKSIVELHTFASELLPTTSQNVILNMKLTELSQRLEVLVSLKKQCEEVLNESNVLADVKKNFTLVKTNLNEISTQLNESNTSQNTEECQAIIHKLVNMETDLTNLDHQYSITLKHAHDILGEYPSLSAKIGAMYHGMDQSIIANKKLLRQRLEMGHDAMNIHYFRAEVKSLEEKMKFKLEEVSCLPVGMDLIDAGEIMTKETAMGKEISHFKFPKSTVNYLFDKLNEDTKVNMYHHLRTIDEMFAALNDIMKNRKLQLDAQLRVHTFLKDMKCLEVWLEQTLSTLSNVLDNHGNSWSLLLHRSAEIKIELDDKLQSLNSVQEYGRLLIQDGLLTSMEVDSKLNNLKTCFQKVNCLWLEREERINWKTKVQKYRDRITDISAWFNSSIDTSSCQRVPSHADDCEKELAQTRILISTLKRQMSSINEIKKSLEKLRDEMFFEENDVLNECTVLERKANDALECVVEKEEKLVTEANLLTLLRKIEELFNWITEQDDVLKKITEIECLQETENALSHFEVKLNSHISSVEDLGKYYEACSSSENNDHQEMMEKLMERWKHLKDNYETAKNHVTTKSFNNDLRKEVYGLETWMESKETDFEAIVLTEDEREIKLTNKVVQDFLSNIRAYDDIFEKLCEDGLLDYVNENVQKDIETLYSRYKILVVSCHTKQEHIEQIQQYLQFCKDVVIERKWMEDKLPLITNELLVNNSNDTEKMHNEIKFLNMEFSHRQSHHAELILCGELLTHEDSTFPFVDSAASTLLQFRHDCNHFNNTLRERLKLIKEILHVYMLLSKSGDLLKGLNEFRSRLPSCTDNLDQTSANSLLKKFQCINIELQGYWSSVDMLENEFAEAKKTSAYPFVKDKLLLMERNLAFTYKDISSVLILNETSVKDASNFYTFKAESAYLDKWIQKQIDLICTDGIGKNLEECKAMLKNAEALARNLIGKEERITAFGELCQEIMNSDILSSRQIAKNTANIYEMWNDVKDLLNSRLEKLSTGCKLHALFEKITDVNQTICQCLESINISFDDLSSLDDERKAIFQLENHVKSLTAQIDEIKIQHTLLHNQLDAYHGPLEEIYIDTNDAFSNLSQTTVTLQMKLSEAEKVNQIMKEVSQIIMWIESVCEECRSYISKTFQSDIPRISISECRKNSDELAAREPYYQKLSIDVKILSEETSSTFSPFLKEEHLKLTTAWKTLVNLMSKWQAKNEDLEQLTHISEDLEAMERWLMEQQTAFSMGNEDTFEAIETALQNCEKLETYFALHDSKIKSTSDKFDLVASNFKNNQFTSNDHLELPVKNLNHNVELPVKNEDVTVLHENTSESDDEFYDAEPTVHKTGASDSCNSSVDTNDHWDEEENISMADEKPESNLSEEKDSCSNTNEPNTCTPLVGILKKLCDNELTTSKPKRNIVFNEFHEVSDGCGNLRMVELNDTYSDSASPSHLFRTNRANSPIGQSFDDIDVNYTSPPPAHYVDDDDDDTSDDTSSDDDDDDNDDDYDDNNDDNIIKFYYTDDASSSEGDIEDFLKETEKQKEEQDDFEWSYSEDIEGSDTSDMAPPPASFFELDDDDDILDGDENEM